MIERGRWKEGAAAAKANVRELARCGKAGQFAWFDLTRRQHFDKAENIELEHATIRYLQSFFSQPWQLLKMNE
jgi:hypothetical protein